MKQFIPQQGKSNCGHIAVAVLTDTSLEQVEKIIGHTHGSRTKELRAALLKLGFDAAERLETRHKWEFPANAFGIIHIRQNGLNTNGHFVALVEGFTYDGHQNGPLNIAEYELLVYLGCWRITAFLPVWKKGAGE